MISTKKFQLDIDNSTWETYFLDNLIYNYM